MASFPRSSPHSKPLLKQTPAQAQHPPRTGHACLMSGRRAEQAAIAFEYGADIEALLPKLRHPDYFTEPWLQELAARERAERGYCRRVCNFSVGRKGYGSVTFFGETDVRWLDLEGIVRFEQREIVVYGDESCKPPAGQGLNKPAEVTLLNVRCIDAASGEHLSEGPELVNFEERLKKKTNEQGAEFVSYGAFSQEWKFRVKHFSRFGLDDSDDEEIPAVDDESHLVQSGMYNAEELELVGQDEDASGDNVSGRLAEISDMGSDEVGAEGSPMAEVQPSTAQTALPHTLPVHLRLDPVKMQQMKMLFFPAGEEAEDIALPRLWDGGPSRPVRMIAAEASGAVRKSPGSNIHRSAHAEDSSPKDIVSKRYKISPQASWQRSPARTTNNFGRQLIMGPHQGLSPNQSRVLLSIENKNEQFVPKRSRIGFKHEIGFESCVSGRTGNVSDASLFLGNSFRVGWGPHGLLVHSGRPVGQVGNVSGLSSIIHMERVSLDSTVRDESGKVREDLIELRFISPLRLHMSMSKIVNGIHEQYSGLRLRYLACNRMELSSVCNEYEDLIFNQQALEGLSGTQHLVLRHQGMVWDLLSVLFSDKLASSELHTEQDEDLDKADGATASLDTIDPEAKCYTRRAEFSRWLQHSVNNSVQVELVDLGVKDHLKEIFSLMTGRQLDDAVQIAASKGDVRLACLLSQAGGSMMNRKDIASQFDVWDQEGLEYSLIEKERIMLYKLLSGDIQGALSDREIDWKRFLGLLMWYHLAPDTELPDIINAYSQLVDEQLAPQPIPLYVEEGALNGVSGVNEKDFYDTSYYLMLLHASNGRGGFDVKKMFCSFSSTYDALDHQMAWFQRAFLEAIGVLSSSQLYVLDMNFVAQLLSVGQCHWAIYAILHMPPSLQYPGLHEKVVKEILNQYCDVWSTTDSQQSFLENELGVPIEWMHEALGIYWQYHGDSHKALDHYLKCHQWHKAHSLFVTSVAVSHFVNSQHADVLKFASHLEKHKAELDNWDLGGGIYIDFYTLKHSFQNDDITEELDSIEKGSACKEFFGRLKASRGLWANRSPEIRVVYSRMADELASLMLAESKAKMLSRSTEMGLYDAVMDAPVPEDIRLCRLQGAVSVFTSWLSETASS